MSNDKFILTVSKNYVAKWGIIEGLREILQNARDCEVESGIKMKLNFSNRKKGGGTLHVVNKEANLPRQTLLLGESGKRDDARMIGKFGEGYKLALLALCRIEGISVEICNGEELWIPAIEPVPEYGGAECLVIRTRKCRDAERGNVIFRVTGISKDDYESIKGMCLFMDYPRKNVVSTYRGQILKDEKYAGKLYSKGLFVCKLPEKSMFGYDLDHIELDRDRKMADPYSLKYNIKDAIKLAVEGGKMKLQTAIRMLESRGTVEYNIFSDLTYETSSGFYEKIAEDFEGKYGENAVPVSNLGQSQEASHHGMNGVVVPDAVKAAVEVSKGKFDDRKESSATDIVKRHSVESIGVDGMNNIQFAINVIKMSIEDGMTISLNDIIVCDFRGDNVIGLFDKKNIYVAHKILCSRQAALKAIVHEFAHHYGADGTVEHRDACDNIFAVACCQLWEKIEE